MKGVVDGLRERSRARRRENIARAALELFVKRGFEATTVAQVADAAVVSPRTVALYFPTKLDLALAYFADSARRLDAACVSRDPGESILSVLQCWLAEEMSNYTDTRALLRTMLDSNPALRGAVTADIMCLRRKIAIEVADDLGRSPEDPIVLLADGAMAGIVAALMQIDPQNDSGATALDFASRLLQDVMDSAAAEPRPAGPP